MTTSNMCICWLERVVLFASNRTPCYSVKPDLKQFFLEYRQIIGLKLVHERNPAPVDVINISFFAGLIWWLSHYLQGLYGKYPIILQGFHTCQVVVNGISEPSATYDQHHPPTGLEDGTADPFSGIEKEEAPWFFWNLQSWFVVSISIFFISIPEKLGESSIQFDDHIFHKWLVKNHQLDRYSRFWTAEHGAWWNLWSNGENLAHFKGASCFLSACRNALFFEGTSWKSYCTKRYTHPFFGRKKIPNVYGAKSSPLFYGTNTWEFFQQKPFIAIAGIRGSVWRILGLSSMPCWWCGCLELGVSWIFE